MNTTDGNTVFSYFFIILMNIFAILNESELHISRVLNTVVFIQFLTIVNKYAIWLIRVISVILGPPLDHCYKLVIFGIEL